MVELQSCATLVNTPALCAIEEVKGEGLNVVVAEIAAELQRERQRNAGLMERISILEAQMQERDNHSLLANGQGSCSRAKDRSYKKFKRQKTEFTGQKEEDADNEAKHDAQWMPPKETNRENHLVSWMSMEDVQFLHFEKSKNSFPVSDCDDTDETDDEDDESLDDNDDDIDIKDGQNEENVKITTEIIESLAPNMDQIKNERDLTENDGKKSEKVGNILDSFLSGVSEKAFVGSAKLIMQKKPPKVAFCPKEVKRILESEALQLKNAQSHTMRKIIVFSSLGIRHGCEDMYELDFNHFSILRKGEPYVSPENPGEHVIYENPGVRRKVYYPNRDNPTLCPVQILEEEKVMRPSDVSCPSCLFLCIKYGGRTRNLPQNEYVRQRMGRNKLKSFGPIMCQMAMLLNIRSGSFFFKALGITLLFMAGFPDDLVQKETNYRNLDLLQKYYRTDEDAKGEELFLSNPVHGSTACSDAQQLTGKKIPAKLKGKKQATPSIKPPNLPKASIPQTTPSSSSPPTQFGLMGYTSSRALFESPTFSNLQASYTMFQPHPSNAFVPMIFWPPPNAFPTCPYPSSHNYQSYPSTGNYLSIHPQPYCSHPQLSPLILNMVEGREKNGACSEEAEIDSESSSSSMEPKDERESLKP
ncbi:hypothetical protein NMG60_11009814 [Bertholletia excelsa]